MRRSPALALLAASLAGCSLVIDDVPVRTCASDSDCTALATLQGVPMTQRPFACVQGRCVRRPPGQEACDGFDNDGDLLVDEPSVDASGATQVAVTAREVFAVPRPGPGGRVRVGVADDGRLGIAWVSSPHAWYAEASYDEDETRFLSLSEPAPMGYLCDPANQGVSGFDLEEGCSVAAPEGAAPADCSFGDVALDLLENHALVAPISTDGCSRGQLEAGFLALGGEPAVIVRGPKLRSNSFLGIDLVGGAGEGSRCSGASNPGCSADPASCGAAHASLAALAEDAGSPQALLAWLGAPLDRPECGGPAVDVDALALFLLTASPSLTEDVSWVTASNEAVPQVLGQTRAGGAPGLAAWLGRGYFVGHGDLLGRIAIHYVPAAPEPPDCDWGCLLRLPADDRSDVATAPLAGIVDLEPIEPGSGAEASDVALAPSRIRPTGDVELGVAWREGCGGASEAIAFSRVVVGLDVDAPTGEIVAGPAVRLSAPPAAGARVGPPAVVYVASGFVVEGFSRGGSAPADASTSGGWWVSWAEASGGTGRVLARRVLELDGLPLDDAEVIEVASLGPVEGELDRPALTVAGDLAYEALHDAQGGRIVLERLSCALGD